MIRTVKLVFLVCFVAANVGACSSVPPESTSENRVQAVTAQRGAGYVHQAANSRFRLGTNVVAKSESGFSKLVGDEGVFATVEHTGWAMGLPNADAASKTVGRTRTADAHNKAVEDYFVAAGLPAGQVGSVQAHANVHAGGAVGTPEADITLKPVASGYTSCLSRIVDGVPVSDSFAWAGFNDNGDVVEESVYWPEIPDAVIDAAHALSQKINGPAADLTYRNQVGDFDQKGHVVIRHSPSVDSGTFQAMASYDVPVAKKIHHYDINGAEFSLPGENVAPQTPR